MLRGLYAITDNTLTPNGSLLEQATQAIAGGAKILQLRDKIHSDTALLPIAKALKALCRQSQVLFIVNDRISLAQQIDADGVHLGRDDTQLSIARKQLPKKIIGVSCYGSIESALHFQNQGADYVAFGACFASPTKPHAPVISPSLIKIAKAQLAIPLCAIGGITTETAPLLISQDIDMLAVISDLWCSDNIAQQARRFSALFA